MIGNGHAHDSDENAYTMSQLQARSRGTQACTCAASTVSGIIGDLDTTIMFATAGTLIPENESETFADHRENIFKTAKALVEDTKTLVAGAASSQEQLAIAAQNAVITMVQLSEVVKVSLLVCLPSIYSLLNDMMRNEIHCRRYRTFIILVGCCIARLHEFRGTGFADQCRKRRSYGVGRINTGNQVCIGQERQRSGYDISERSGKGKRALFYLLALSTYIATVCIYRCYAIIRTSVNARMSKFNLERTRLLFSLGFSAFTNGIVAPPTSAWT